MQIFFVTPLYILFLLINCLLPRIFTHNYRLFHGWWARTIFIHKCVKQTNERNEEFVLHNEWIKIVQANYGNRKITYL